MWLSALALVFVLVLVLMVVVVLSTGVCVLGEQAHTYVNQAVAKLLTGIKADPSLQTALDLNEMDTRKLDFFKRQAEQLVAANVTLIDEQAADDKILQIIKECPAGATRGEQGKHTHVVIYYDQQDSGEATAQPHIRTPPLFAPKGST